MMIFEKVFFLWGISGGQKGMDFIFMDDVVADLGENVVQEFMKMIVK